MNIKNELKKKIFEARQKNASDDDIRKIIAEFGADLSIDDVEKI